MKQSPLEVIISIRPKISWWDALKMRLAGAVYIQKLVEREFRQFQPRCPK